VRRWSAAPPPVGATAFAPDARERTLLAGVAAPVVAVLGSHRPFAFMTPDGTPAGLSVDMLRALLDRLGWVPKAWRSFEPEALAQAPRRGEVDWVVGLDESAQFDDVLNAGSAAGAPMPALVVMSAELGDADMQALREAGADLVLAKASDATLFVRQLLKHPALRGAQKEALA
jgi:ABC-type amino acid transport substrate-binding protein